MQKSLLPIAQQLAALLLACLLVYDPAASSGQDAAGSDLSAESFQFSAPPGMTTPEYLRHDLPMQSGYRCGPNGIYMLLKICGVDCSYQDILEALEVTEKGANLADLCEVAKSYGVVCEARKNLSPEDVELAPKPLIIQLKAEGQRNPELPQDHFALITEIADDHGYIGVDTTNGTNVRFTQQMIARSMTGYALIVTDSNAARARGKGSKSLLAQVTWVLFFILILFNITVLFKKFRR